MYSVQFDSNKHCKCDPLPRNGSQNTMADPHKSQTSPTQANHEYAIYNTSLIQTSKAFFLCFLTKHQFCQVWQKTAEGAFHKNS